MDTKEFGRLANDALYTMSPNTSSLGVGLYVPDHSEQADDEKFVDWYERTKDGCRSLFGREPQLDMWPTSQRRLVNASSWKRIDTFQFWMIPRRSLCRASAWSVGALALMVGGVG